MVHAEMEALLSCARSGVSPVGGTLYSTTFPCHNCAKHIVAAGLRRVVYVEPYPKSRAVEFFNRSQARDRVLRKTLVQAILVRKNALLFDSHDGERAQAIGRKLLFKIRGTPSSLRGVVDEHQEYF